MTSMRTKKFERDKYGNSTTHLEKENNLHTRSSFFIFLFSQLEFH